MKFDFCCKNCFNDKFLQRQIEQFKPKVDVCPHCNAVDSHLVPCSDLFDYFAPFLELYKPSNGGISLAGNLQKDFQIFNKPCIGSFDRLICEILGEDFDKNHYFFPVSQPFDADISKWENFREELRHENRFFPQQAPDKSLFQEFSRFLGREIQIGELELFRARIQNGENPYVLNKMGKPPINKAAAGRANPIGISYLYAASTPKTAIAEVRGNKTDYVSVVKIIPIERLALVDLRDPINSISPFEWPDELNQIRSGLPYFKMLAQELSKPVLPVNAPLEYLATQYLCEIIKQLGFDGIIFRSSVGPGDNYVLFSEEKLRRESVSRFQITKIQYSSKKG